MIILYVFLYFLLGVAFLKISVLNLFVRHGASFIHDVGADDTTIIIFMITWPLFMFMQIFILVASHKYIKWFIRGICNFVRKIAKIEGK